MAFCCVSGWLRGSVHVPMRPCLGADSSSPTCIQSPTLNELDGCWLDLHLDWFCRPVGRTGTIIPITNPTPLHWRLGRTSDAAKCSARRSISYCPVGISESVRRAGVVLRKVDHGGSEPSLRSRTTRCPRSVTPRSLSCWFHPSRVPIRVVSSNSPLDSSSRVRRANFA